MDDALRRALPLLPALVLLGLAAVLGVHRILVRRQENLRPGETAKDNALRRALPLLPALVLFGLAAVLGVRYFLDARSPALRVIYRVDVEEVLRSRLAIAGGDLQERLGDSARLRRDGASLRLTASTPAALEAARQFLAKEHGTDLTWQSEGQNGLLLGLATPVERVTRDHILGRTFDVVRKRLSWTDATVSLEADRLHLKLPSRAEKDLDAIKRVLARGGKLEFRLADDTSDLFERLAQQVTPGSDIRVIRDSYDGKSRGQIPIVTLGAPSLEKLKSFVEPSSSPLLALNREILYGWSTDERGKRIAVAFHVFRQSKVGGEQISDAEVQWDEPTGRPELGLTFDAAGSMAFEQLTGAYVGWRLAIVLDGQVSSAPVLQAAIKGGRIRITFGNLKAPATLKQEARDLLDVLRGGELPAPLRLESVTKR